MERSDMQSVYKKLSEMFPQRIKESYPLAAYTTFKIGGPADLFFDARTQEELVAAYRVAKEAHIPIVILGGGSNILISDKGVRGLVIKNATSTIAVTGMSSSTVSGEKHEIVYLHVDSGVPFNKLVRYTIEEGLAGFEMHLGLPGSVGGAVFMNSKWTHPMGAVGDHVAKATILTKEGELKIVPKEYFHFAYDTSILQKTGEIVTSVLFALKKTNKDALWEVANSSIAYRRDTQPQGVHTAGCVFRNIAEADAIVASTPGHTTSAGLLIDHAGLKGFHIGGAYVSNVHANFIENKGGASASDVIQLIAHIKEAVKKQFGVTLSEEIRRIGDFT